MTEESRAPPKYHWEEVGNDWVYTPTEADLGHQLRVVCAPGDGQFIGTDAESISKSVVIPAPHCPFEDRHKLTVERAQGDRLVTKIALY